MNSAAMLLHRCSPRVWLSRLYGWLARRQHGQLRNWLIKRHMQRFNVSLDDAQITDPQEYPHFEAYITRQLKPEARPLAPAQNALLAPADGIFLAAGELAQGQLLQAKQQALSVHQLLGHDIDLSSEFYSGTYFSMLIPDAACHRVYMPCAGTLEAMMYVPGQLWDHRLTVSNGGYLCQSERVIIQFATAFGPMLMILIGSVLAGSIHTVWEANASQQHSRNKRRWRYPNPKTEALEFAAGDEIAHFSRGSQVMILFKQPAINFIQSTSVIRGQMIAQPEEVNDGSQPQQ